MAVAVMMMGHFGERARHPMAGGWHRVHFPRRNQYVDAAADASCMPMHAEAFLDPA